VPLKVVLEDFVGGSRQQWWFASFKEISSIMVIDASSGCHSLIVVSDVVVTPIDELMYLLGRFAHELVNLNMAD